MEINDQERALISSDIQAYLKQHQDKDLLRFLTCGSVDDGKSTLIGRLLFDSKLIYEDQLAAIEAASATRGTVEGETDLALLTDGLRAEREQGITIDVAYRFFSTASRKFIIADTPGHEQYTRNMATGASTADLAIVLVDARHGLLSQTKRHSFIASLLGIKHMVVAINKMDLVEYAQSVFDQIVTDFRNFSARLNIPDIQFVPMSALKGDNVVHRSTHMQWYQGAPILSILERVHIASDRNMIDFRLPVQYVLRPHLNFRGYQGTIASGKLAVGDEVVVQPSGQTSMVTQILVGDQDTTTAFAPQAVTVTLAHEIDISRGDMFVKPKNRARYDTLFEAMVVWMHDEPLRINDRHLIKMGPQTVPADTIDIRYTVNVNTLERDEVHDAVGLNSVGRVLIETQRAVVFDPYERNRATGGFIVVDRFTNVTIGAGMILDRDSAQLRRARREQTNRSESLTQTSSAITQSERAARLNQSPHTIWLTGLPRSGKTTIAMALESALWKRNKTVCILDGTNLRLALNRDLGFTAEDRREACRRGAQTARLLNEQGMIVIAAFVSPYTEIRRLAKDIIGDAQYLEIHVDAPAAVCMERDQKNGARVYEQAEQGTIRAFTGVSAGYDTPTEPFLKVDTENKDVDECVADIINALEKRGIV